MSVKRECYLCKKYFTLSDEENDSTSRYFCEYCAQLKEKYKQYLEYVLSKLSSKSVDEIKIKNFREFEKMVSQEEILKEMQVPAEEIVNQLKCLLNNKEENSKVVFKVKAHDLGYRWAEIPLKLESIIAVSHGADIILSLSKSLKYKDVIK